MNRRRSTSSIPNKSALLVFAAISICAIVAVVAYALWGRGPRARQSGPGSPAGRADRARLADLRKRPHLLFRNAELDNSFGQIAVVPIDSPGGDRLITDLACERVYGTPDIGLCLTAARGFVTSYGVTVFDARFTAVGKLKLEGAPSRTRVSPHGRRGASTVFVSGDSYSSGSFSTRTTIFDLGKKSVIADLEEFSVTKDGAAFKQKDFNFWGVTFTDDDDRFYATLGSGGRIYLVEGQVSTRTAHTVREGIECPSLSPDGTRLVFKNRKIESGRLVWRLTVLDLKTMVETPLSETRSVDDQAAWLDDGRVLYALARDVGSADVWVVRADGSGTPSLFLRDATSPVAIWP